MGTQKPKRATVDDIEEVMDLAHKFHAYSIYKGIPFNEEAARSFTLNIIDQGACFFTGEGFVGGVIVPLYFNPKVRIATEIVWFSPSGGGRELREHFEVWAIGQDASMIQFSALASGDMDDVHRNLSKNGYDLAELTFIRRLK